MLNEIIKKTIMNSFLFFEIEIINFSCQKNLVFIYLLRPLKCERKITLTEWNISQAWFFFLGQKNREEKENKLPHFIII